MFGLALMIEPDLRAMVSVVIAVAVQATLVPATRAATENQQVIKQSPAKPRTNKQAVTRHRPHWVTPPGYRPPGLREEEGLDWPLQYWYGWPGFYHGRWNGGGFGPCWTKTPIGPIWNCGR
jgi:hypothetical protein